MAAVAVLLALTNLLTLAVLAAVVLARRRLEPLTAADPAVAAALAPADVRARPRQVISVEILNPVEVAARRNRLVGFAGAFVPRLTQRIVTDQVLRTLRQELADQQVAADVRVHRIAPSAAPPEPDDPLPSEIEGAAVFVVDEVTPVRFGDDQPE